MASRKEITRDVLARIIVWLVVILTGATFFVVIFQRPLGISADGVRTAERIFFANFVIALSSHSSTFRDRGSLGKIRNANLLRDVGNAARQR